jgi:mannose-6-phosphate isomerase-like protein (cupin superfamily)
VLRFDRNRDSGLSWRPGGAAAGQIGRRPDMSDQKQKFSASYAKDATYKPGLREFMEYRDLGIEDATHGAFRAHVIRIKDDHKGEALDMHTTGLHQHMVDFQMFYVLKGWVSFIYDGQGGPKTFHAGDCVLQPAGIVHNELQCSDDLEILEIYSPAVHETRKVEKMAEAAAE